MNMRKRSAKQLTFIYFSIISFTIILVNAIVVDSTIDGVENLVAENRIVDIKEFAVSVLERGKIKELKLKDDVYAYYNADDMNLPLDEPASLPLDTTIEVLEKGSYVESEAFIQRTLDSNGRSIYIVFRDDPFNDNERHTFFAQSKTISSTLLLMLVSLFAILKVSSLLTDPLAKLSQELDKRTAHDLSPINNAINSNTKEMDMLIDTLNNHYQRISQLMEREQAFTRYASHELRTPLMVMKGATSLLGQSDKPEFIERQKNRLSHATDEMSDFIETLLSLTREIDDTPLSERALSKKELIDIAQSHEHLISNKSITWRLELEPETTTLLPVQVLKILLGNLIKNAFACTEQGEIIISIQHNKFVISDTGVGLGSKPRGVEGYGLGLLIVRDICQRYQYDFILENRELGQETGCIASIIAK